MIETVGSALAAMPPLGVGMVAGAGVVAGIALFPLISKISQVAIGAFKSLCEWMKDGAIPIRIRSLTCNVCASGHRLHMYSSKSTSALPSTPAPS